MTALRDARPIGLTVIVDALRVATRTSFEVAFVIGDDGKILMANPRLCSRMGVDEHTLIGRPFDVAARSHDSAVVLDGLARALSGEPARYVSTGTRADGEAFVAHVSMLPVIVDGAVLAVFGTALDMTDATQHDLDARRGEDVLRMAGRLARFGGWSVDAETRAVTITQGTLDMLGIPADTPDVGAVAWARHPDESRPELEALVEACLIDGTPFELESVMYTMSGERLSIRTVGEAERRSDQSIARAYGAVWDVSAIAESRERERALEARLASTLNAIPQGIIFTDTDRRLTFANRHACELLDTHVDGVIGSTIDQVFAGERQEGFRRAFDRTERGDGRQVHRAQIGTDERWIESTSYAAEDGLAIYLRDVTDDERARAVARSARQQLEQQAALLDSARDAMIVLDLDNRVLYWNRAATEYYGWTADEAHGRWVGDLFSADVRTLDAMTAAVLRDGYYTEEVQHRTRDGRALEVDVRLQLITDADGHPTSFFAVATDITDWRREQDARLRAQRMEALGTLAGGIAHDLNNVLTPILMSVQLLAMGEHEPERRELLSTAETAVKRGAEMVRQVLSFARGVEGRRIAIDLDRLLDEYIALTRELLPPGIVVEVHREPHEVGTVGDPTQLLQVFMNLSTNARDAMNGQGTLRISTTTVELGPDDVMIGESIIGEPAAPGRYSVITVDDSGAGMSADVAARIFEPFFTTKAPGKGTGLGLAASLAIVRSHGGYVQVRSELGTGTRFVVGLPIRTDGAAAVPASKESVSHVPHGSEELVLVIDDDETICQITSRTLQAHGYQTLTASNGLVAIELIERGQEAIDLVLTDMMMPGMDGAATSAYLEEHHPHIPIIAASGLNTGGPDSRAVGMGISRLIAKPYTTSLLLMTVRETLDDHRFDERRPRG